MRKKLTVLAFALAASATAFLSAPKVEAACPVYCCPGTTRCINLLQSAVLRIELPVGG